MLMRYIYRKLTEIEPKDQSYYSHFKWSPSVILSNIKKFAPSRKIFLDFGCGHGIQSIAVALANPSSQVFGVDVTRAFELALPFCRDKLRRSELPPNLKFLQIEPGQDLSEICTPDVIYSWSVLEHVERAALPGVVANMRQALAPRGVVFTQIAPLFYSPHGHHLYEYVKEPWAHLIHSPEKFKQIVLEGVVADEVAARHRAWMFTNYEELNRITSADLQGYFVNAGFENRKIHEIKVPLRPSESLLKDHLADALTTSEIIFVHQSGKI